VSKNRNPSFDAHLLCGRTFFRYVYNVIRCQITLSFGDIVKLLKKIRIATQ